MKNETLLTIAWLLTVMATAFASSAAPVFQLRLVLDDPSPDTELMNLVTRDRDNHSVTNVLNVQKTVLLDETALSSAKATKNGQGDPTVYITFTEGGAKRMAEVTRQNINKRLAIIVGGRTYAAPIIMSEISRAAMIGVSDEREMRDVAKKLNDAMGKK